MDNLTADQLYLLLAVVAAAGFMLGRASGGGESADERAERRFREAQSADALVASLSPQTQAGVDKLLNDGKIIEAIRLIRSETGVGLREAKLAADARLRQLG